jgi:ATP-binding protein involved in chromosome partitioning
VRAGGDNGKPIVVSRPDSAPALALRSVAEFVAAALSVAALQQDSGISLTMI